MKLLYICGVFGLTIALLGCERAPDLEQPTSYDENGIAFSLPGNWNVTEDVTESGEIEYRYIIVETAGDALVMITRFVPPADVTLEEFAELTVASLLEEAAALGNIGPIEPIKATAGKTLPVSAQVSGLLRDGIEQRFVVSLLGQAAPHRLRMFQIDAAGTVAFLSMQSASEDWTIVAPGFDLISTTLVVEAGARPN